MDNKTKHLLRSTIDSFKYITPEVRQSKINFIKEQLKMENNHTCFFEPAKHFIDAAKIFLRIADKIPYIKLAY